jgi:O-antigen ligase
MLRQANTFAPKIKALIFAAFLTLVFVFGGSSRADAFSQIVVRVVSVLFAAAFYLMSSPRLIDLIKPVFYGLVLFVGLMILQLIPLPFVLWAQLPGRQVFAEFPEVFSISSPWRPISLAPDATLNSILSILPGLAAIVGFSVLRSYDRFWLVCAMIALTLVSGAIGILQLTGQSSWLYLYQGMSDGTAVGFFANRNHQAALLCSTLPMLAAFAACRDAPGSPSIRAFIAALSSIVILPLIVVTGSRTGVLLMAVGLTASYMIYQRAGVNRAGLQQATGNVSVLTRRQWLGVAALAAIVLTFVLLIASSKAVAIQRAFAMDVEADARLRLFWPMIDLLSTYFPFGTGFGSFPQVFKVFEPFSNLGPAYFNHAHNDALELLIEGGVAGALILFVGGYWWIRKALVAWRGPGRSDCRLLAQVGSAVTLIFGIASLTDYPLRTPICSVVFLMACCLMSVHPQPAKERQKVGSEQRGANHGVG